MQKEICIKTLVTDDITRERLRYSSLNREDKDFLNTLMDNPERCLDSDIDLKYEIPEILLLCYEELNLWVEIAESNSTEGVWFVVNAYKETIY